MPRLHFKKYYLGGRGLWLRHMCKGQRTSLRGWSFPSPEFLVLNSGFIHESSPWRLDYSECTGMPLDHWKLRDEESSSCPCLEIESGAVSEHRCPHLQSMCGKSLVCRTCSFKILIDICKLPYQNLYLFPSFTSIWKCPFSKIQLNHISAFADLRGWVYHCFIFYFVLHIIFIP